MDKLIFFTRLVYIYPRVLKRTLNVISHTSLESKQTVQFQGRISLTSEIIWNARKEWLQGVVGCIFRILLKNEILLTHRVKLVTIKPFVTGNVWQRKTTLTLNISLLNSLTSSASFSCRFWRLRLFSPSLSSSMNKALLLLLTMSSRCVLAIFKSWPFVPQLGSKKFVSTF